LPFLLSNQRYINYVDTLRIHSKKHHNIAWKGDTAALYKGVKVQTFFCVGGLQRYFVVRAGDSSNALAVSCKVADIVKERLAESQLTQHVRKERAQVMDTHIAKTDKTGGFKLTGWLERFANRNLMHLVHQTRLPNQGKAAAGGKADRAAGRDERQDTVDACTRDEAVAEERKATGG
jgi:hypothetical protein